MEPVTRRALLGGAVAAGLGGDTVRALGRRTQATAAYAKGAHTRGYWNRVTPAAFAWLAARLTP